MNNMPVLYLGALSLGLYVLFFSGVYQWPTKRGRLPSCATLMYQTVKCSHDTFKFQDNVTALLNK